MQDIEDMLAGAPAGFRLPITDSVGVNPKKNNKKKKESSSIQHFLTPLPSPKIPGTQVFLYNMCINDYLKFIIICNLIIVFDLEISGYLYQDFRMFS